MGIDPSMNSTGICIDEDGKRTYYLVSTKATKKAIKAANEIDQLCILQIPKEESLKEEKSIHNNVLELLGTSSEVATVDRVIAQLQGLDLMKITLISDITNVTEEST